MHVNILDILTKLISITKYKQAHLTKRVCITLMWLYWIYMFNQTLVKF